MHFDSEPLPALYADHLERLGRLVGEALGEHGLEALVLSAGSLSPTSRFDDQHWPFRPTPAFTHWVPLREPGSALIVRPGATPRLIRAEQAGFWDAPPRIESHHIWSSFEVCETAVEEVKAYLPSTRRCAFIGDDPDRGRAWGFDEAQLNPSGLIASLDAIRTRKSEYEIECVRRANRIAAQGHALLSETFASAETSELALHLRYLEATQQDDPDTPYKNIVAIAENAATLHHVGYDRSPRRGAESSLLVDAGATYLGYASDVTRTWTKGQSPAADTFGELVRRIDELQRRIVAEIAPGVSFEALHDRAHELLAEVLRDLDLVRAEPAAIVDSGATRAFFPHGLGHSLGVQVHDVGLRTRAPRPDNPFLRNTSDVAPGHVFTIEPGCYFIGSLMDELRGRAIAADVCWSVVDSLRPFGGVRIEDNVAVTEAGTENLTRPALDEALNAARGAP
jgi:Xaa-Pro dipeptidase